MERGELPGSCPGRARPLVDGQYHNVDSSEMAFKIAGSMAFKDAVREGRPGAARADHGGRGDRPDEAVGAVNGDLNSRRGRLHGMEPTGG